MSHRLFRRSSLVLGLLVCLAAPAQEPDHRANPDSFGGKDSSQSVYVRDSAVAMEKFALAQRMERLKEWDKSADVYQEILEKYADRVVPSQVDKDNNIYQYSSVSLVVQERLARWPQDGLDYYRLRFGAEAQAALQVMGADDFAGFHRVYSRYFVTDAGKAAGLRLMALYLEAGEFPAAAWLGDRLLNWHPNLTVERPDVLYRTSLAYHLAGNAKLASERLEQLRRDHGDALGTVRGQDVVLAESLQDMLQAPAWSGQGLPDGSWPMFGGSPSRDRVSDAAGSPGAKLYDVPLSSADYAWIVNPQQRRQRQAEDQSQRANGLTLGIMPAVEDGELYFQDGVRLFGVSLESGVPLPGWEQRGQSGRTASPPNQPYTVTLTADSALAVMGRPEPGRGMIALPRGGRQNDTRLVCVDRQTGRQRWAVTPSRLPESAAGLRSADLVGSPLVVGQSVFVTLRGGQGMQFEDCYLLCVDLVTGDYRWSCYLASASTGAPIWTAEIDTTSTTIPQMAYAGGRLYVLTNVGALAAVDAYGGTILWLNVYPREAALDFLQAARFGGVNWDSGLLSRITKPWSHSPPVVHDGRIYLLPSDGKHLLVYDAGSGVELKRIERTQIDRASALLGLYEGRPIVCSDRRVFCINWEAFDPAKRDYENLHWRSDLSDVRGRGFVTASHVFIPTAEALHRIALDSGKVVERYPPSRAWGDGEEPGNVLVVGDQVVIAGSTRVNVYTDLELARAKLDAELAAAPNDPEPRLRYAEVMFAAGQPDEALQKLDEAVALAGGPGALRQGPVRTRIFSDALNFARKLADHPCGSSSSLAEQLFDRAEQAASSPAQQVSYLLARGGFERKCRQPESAVEAYQRILRDPSYRDVSSASDGGTAPASVLAKRAIDELIKQHGRTIYASYEQEARGAIEQPGARSDPQRLMEIAAGYPNAEGASEALLAAAEAFESRGDPRRATQVLRQLLLKQPDAPQRVRLTEALARNYLSLPGGIEVAIAQLARGVKQDAAARLERPLTMPDGTVLENVTFFEALQALRDHQQRLSSARLPDFHLPNGKRVEPFLPETPESNIEGVARLVVPIDGRGRLDRIVTWTDGRLSVFAVGETSPLFSVEGPRDPAVQHAWVGSTLLAWGGGELLAVDGEKGQVQWRTDLASLPAAQPPALAEAVEEAPLPAEQAQEQEVVVHILQQRLNQLAPPPEFAAPQEQGEEILNHVRPLSNRVVVSSSTGRLAALELDGGRLAWQHRVGPGALHQLEATDDFTAIRGLDEVGMQIIAFNSFDGAAVARWSFADGVNVPLNMALAPDGTLVYLLPDRLCGKDLFEPGMQLSFSVPGGGAGGGRFQLASRPGQLLVADGRIVVLCDDGRFVQVHALEDGQVVTYHSDQLGREVEALLPTGSTDPQVTLHHVGPRLYVVGSSSLVAYNLDRPEDTWDKPRDELLGHDRRENFLATFIGEDYLVLLDNPTPKAAVGGAPLPQRTRQADGGKTHRLSAFSRATLPESGDRESGVWDYIHWLDYASPLTPDQWQAVEGGFYFRTDDGKLHFLRGAREGKS